MIEVNGRVTVAIPPKALIVIFKIERNCSLTEVLPVHSVPGVNSCNCVEDILKENWDKSYTEFV